MTKSTYKRCDSENWAGANNKMNFARYGTQLEVGRIVVMQPLFARINIYMKTDKNRGAIVICERDGGRYGVTKGVLKRFSEPGSHSGWAYVNPKRTIVFKFVIGDASKTPCGLVSIETSNGMVDFPRAANLMKSYSEGALVAFYARLVRTNKRQKQRRQATDVFLLDGEHLPLIARLISNGSFNFPEHNEVCDFFLDTISGSIDIDRQCRCLFESALSYLATSSSVPSQYQTLARVEQSRLVTSGNTLITSRRVESKPSKPKKFTKRKLMVTQQKSSIVTDDVMQVGLRIEEE